MADGSLERCLYAEPPAELSLVQRVSICSDIAEGMAYLHHHSPDKVIHCDLKPSNVLINDDMTALISDFSISWQSAMSISVSTGTFGVLVLEVVTRRKPTDDMLEGGLSLHDWVRGHRYGRHTGAVVDPALARMVQD
ncbi:hypothetical protein BAE44_0005169 [Dichanthelium oligosanthes]|uniref:Protein kinase domain-containing protein n=1 Tax=Dichanthelium oligosanthes TaxID=888268 RepID=A0A1E5W8V6_9POAL|nr:hypothetical protein BAE44_0005169 [Dichanthelium oligosanthes]